jgi:hypothetical protein
METKKIGPNNRKVDQVYSETWCRADASTI